MWSGLPLRRLRTGEIVSDSHLHKIESLIDHLAVRARLADIEMFMAAGERLRTQMLSESLSLLPPGSYLVGCGPYCSDIMRLGVEKVTLGRSATAWEKLPDEVADILVDDSCWFRPREVSRIHASIVRRNLEGITRFFVNDETSSTGTFVNGRRLAREPKAREVQSPAEIFSGDRLILGPSGINAFVFLEIE